MDTSGNRWIVRHFERRLILVDSVLGLTLDDSLVDEPLPRQHIHPDETPSAGRGYHQCRLHIVAQHVYLPSRMVTASRTATTTRGIGYVPQRRRLFPAAVERHLVVFPVT